MKVCTIVGARPQFIKAAVVSRAIREKSRFTEVLIHTGQHYDESLSDVFFDELDIPRPDHYLGIGSAMHGAQTGRMLEAIEQVLIEEQPDWVLLYGDTNSTLAGALAAVKLHLSVAHVEAGLRSYNRRMPEEVNRVLTDHSADLLFAPTQRAVENLRQEGILEDKIHHVGDVMYDAALYYTGKANSENCVMDRLGIEPQSYILATVHRQENTDRLPQLKAIFGALSRIAKEIPVVLPLHPRTRNALDRNDLLADASRRLTLIDPVGYLEMLLLERNARLIATDSGGVQKEAFFHHVPCVTLREETEWVELIDHGWNHLAPPHSAGGVTSTILAALGTQSGAEVSLYGGGKAARAIVTLLA